MFFSVIVPLYNRPAEITEMLESLTKQAYHEFEVIVVEDGSMNRSEEIVRSFSDRLQIHYYFKENQGQGFARNYGFARAKGDYFIVFDSDIIVPDNYFQQVVRGLKDNGWDAFGGPDAAHKSFTPIQKAISYSMTSPFTTGGIRGNKNHVGIFHPRSFNMGISRKVWEETGGFKLSRRSEDIEFSIRLINAGYKVGLIPDARVYHKRRTSLNQFYRQAYAFGRGRIDIYCLYPKELKPVHALPALFVLGVYLLVMINVTNFLTLDGIYLLHLLGLAGNLVVGLYILILLVHALIDTGSIRVAVLSVLAAFTQLWAYGSGFLSEYAARFLMNKKSQSID